MQSSSISFIFETLTRSKAVWAFGSIIASLAIMLAVFCLPARAVGTWASCTTNPYDINMGLYLLSDGSVLVQGQDYYNGTWHWDSWFRLTPDNTGNYADGTWTQLATSPWGSLDYPSMLLSNGNFWMAGGEYTTNTDPDADQHVQIYDPVTNTWSAGPDAPLNVSDTGAAMLGDGNILVGTDDYYSTETQLYNVTSSSWSYAGDEIGGNGDEANWQLLADGSVFDCYYSSPTSPSQRYVPALAKWIDAADCPITISAQEEEGPLVYLENGTIFCVSDNGPTALYTPPTTQTGLGSWALGPVMPNGDVNGDAPAAIEPNGKVLIIGSPYLYGPTDFYEYDPSTNSFATVTDPLSYQPSRSDLCRMLVLPNGQILFSDYSSTLEVYTADSGSQSSWQPTVTNVTSNGDGSYTLTGTQLTGRSYGACYGDDYMPSTDFPIVYLTDHSGHLYYCRTYGYSTRAIWTGSTPETCDFTVPTGVAGGNYSLFVSVNGVSSALAYSFTVGASNNPPTLSTLIPSSVIAGSAGFGLTVEGTGFLSGAVVAWNGTSLATTVDSSSQLTATVPASDVANPGTASVTATNPGTSSSNALAFAIDPQSENPSATITSLSPNSATVGSAGFTLTVTGTRIAAGAVVDWNGAALSSTFVSATEITATVPAALLNAVVPVNVTVTNPGADPSNALPFTINSKPVIPADTISSLSPNFVVVGSPAFTLVVDGSGFADGASVNWNGTALATTYVSATELTADVPASDVAAVASVSVTVTNPGASASNSLPMAIEPLHSFAQGLQLFSVPYDYSNYALFEVLGYSNPVLAAWSPSQAAYALSPNSPADALRLGQGYWARFPQAVSLDAAGAVAPTTGPFSIPLAKGWNMIGDPFLSPVNMSSLMVQEISGTQYTFAQANQAGLVRATLYSYPANATAYSSQTSGPIEPYVGYWVLAGQNCILLVPAPSG